MSKPQNKITPRGKYILVKPENPDERVTKQGLLLPANTEQEPKAQGKVIAVGEYVNGVEVGDQVIFGAYAGEDMKIWEGIKEQEYKLLHDDDVIAFIK